MTQLDPETADLIAAHGVQRVLALNPGYLSETVPLTLVALLAADKIDLELASHVIRHADRFCLVPSPIYIDAKWHVEANALLQSAHPFDSVR